MVATASDENHDEYYEDEIAPPIQSIISKYGQPPLAADFVSECYDGDLNNLLEAAHGDREETRTLVKEIKGVGDLGVELFFNNVQGVWPSIAPFLDSRSLNTADEIGIGRDLDAIYGVLGHEPEDMSLLANGLSQVRLENKRV
ncbi:TruB pseudouridylate synthase (N terminal domain) family protein [Penicillium angulare]|uniref:TruB pseudouridylate synthase (N terminal domain) family protein n=1 Tax=Penicillium angulare TaxID=116970 RepID=UPI0025408B38|nr:TruB pseudouridylate synthase (N terminal domain) family protein [Penicillium angulare]KAJ5279297.1 TruB pseudouridylate synthase (N terminal domain) family protein [Penicillium angulare]